MTVATGAIAALTLAASPAQADPEILIPPPPPPGEQSISVQAAPGPDPAPPAEVPHLSSPENLPPGTTDDPTEPPQGAGVSYLRDLWHAVQTQEISGRDALLLLTQRPLDSNAVPPNGLAAGPQAPLPEAAPPEPMPPEGAPPAPLPPEAAPPAPLPEAAPPAPLPEAAPPEPVPAELAPPPAAPPTP